MQEPERITLPHDPYKRCLEATHYLPYDFLQGTANQPRQALPTKVLTIPEVMEYLL